MSSHRISALPPKPCTLSHSSAVRWSAGSTALRMAVTSVVSISACWVLIRSVDDQDSPSIKGGMPVRATSCSRI